MLLASYKPLSALLLPAYETSMALRANPSMQNYPQIALLLHQHQLRGRNHLDPLINTALLSDNHMLHNHKCLRTEANPAPNNWRTI